MLGHQQDRKWRVAANRPRVVAAFVAVAVLGVASVASAKRVTVPVDVGIGPALYHGPGPLFANDSVFGAGPGTHLGLKIEVAAILSNKIIRENINRVPRAYRNRAKRMDQVRYGPSIFIPDALFISPDLGGVGMYGVTWRPYSLGMTLNKRQPRVTLSAGLLVTAALAHGARLPQTTFFLRPGLDLALDVEIPITRSFLVSLGYAGQLYVPQVVGGGFFEVGFDAATRARSIWAMGQLYVRLHFRFPYTANI